MTSEDGHDFGVDVVDQFDDDVLSPEEHPGAGPEIYEADVPVGRGTGAEGGLYPGLPCWCDGDIPDDLDFEPLDPISVSVDPAADTVIGNPEVDAEYWLYQGDGNGTCAPTSVAMILSDVLNVALPSDAIIQRALELGVLTFDPSKEGIDAWSGMNDAGIITLAESFGLDVNLRYGDIEDLANYLGAGHAITVGIDADEVWYGEDDETDSGMGGNHQVVVTGIDLTNGVVYLNDSGTPDGQASAIPLDQFADAWADCSNSMIVTDLPSDEAAFEVDVQAALGLAPEGSPISEVIVPGDANYFIDPALVPVADSPPAEVIHIEDPVVATPTLTQLLILPFTFIARFSDRVL
jgi:hypothetical protein